MNLKVKGLNYTVSLQDIYQAVEDYNNLEPRISAAKAEANASLAEATDLKARADELYAESTRVSLQDVQGT